MEPILVTAYVSPDLDGVGGAIAYSEFLNKTGQEAVAGIFGAPHDEAKYVLDRFHIPYPRKLESAGSFERIVLVDSSEILGLEGKVPPEKVVEIIDHRKVNDAAKFPNAKVQIELVGAAVTLVAERFMQGDVAISKESAILLEAGIISNTLNFKSGTTTDRDCAAAVWLNRFSGLPSGFAADMFRAKSNLDGGALEERMRADFALFAIGGKNVSIAQLEIVDGERLIQKRLPEILCILRKLSEEHRLDHNFLTLIDLEAGQNFIVSGEPATQNILSKALHISFANDLARREGLIMRKQIVPLIKEVIEATHS